MIPAVPVEGVVNEIPGIRRTALVGVGAHSVQAPVLCVEMDAEAEWTGEIEGALQMRLNETRWANVVKRCLVHKGFPVDPRHNSKIKREELRHWAQAKCGDLIGVVQ